MTGGAGDEHHHEGHDQGEKGPELQLIEHLQQRITAVFSQPFIESLEEVVEH